MIYSKCKNSDLVEFVNLLERTKSLALEKMDRDKINTGQKFEKFVFSIMQECTIGTIFHNQLYQTKDREFPDIIAKNYWGVEVKYTKDDKWKSIGNSVLESSRIENINKIYLFFCKAGGKKLDIKYRLYEECLYGIVVTHYPRYEIDMMLPLGDSIFDKMNISYDKLRLLESPVKKIRKYYKDNLKKDNSLWWIDDDLNGSKSFEITFFNNLSIVEKQHLILEGFILYPSVFKRQYAELCAFWVSYYSVICPNMRDQYSSGGRKKITDEHCLANILEQTSIANIYDRFYTNAHKINKILKNIDLKLVSNCWNIELNTRDQLYDIWYQKIDEYASPEGSGISVSELFQKIINEQQI